MLGRQPRRGPIFYSVVLSLGLHLFLYILYIYYSTSLAAAFAHRVLFRGVVLPTVVKLHLTWSDYVGFASIPYHERATFDAAARGYRWL